jgi:hypothetical protein
MIHSLKIRDDFETNFKYKDLCTGAAFDPSNTAFQPKAFPGITEIPTVLSINYKESTQHSTLDFLSSSQVIEILNNQSFIIDLVFWTKPEKKAIICLQRECYSCTIAKEVNFQRVKSTLQIVFDKPNSSNNSMIDYSAVENITVFKN